MEAGFQLALDSAPFLLKGAYYTVILSLGGMFFGLLLGFGLALMRLSRFKLVSWLARVYVSFFRGTPLLVQLFLIYYGLPQVGIELDPIPAAMIGFSLNMAASAVSLTSEMKLLPSGGKAVRMACGRMARRRVCARVMPILAAASHWPRSMEPMAARRISQA